MPDDKDRLGDLLDKKKKADEDRFFAERDKALLEKMRKTAATEAPEPPRMRCPKDGTALVTLEQRGVTIDECPTCQGMWLDRGELEQLAGRERDSWLGRYFFRSKA